MRTFQTPLFSRYAENSFLLHYGMFCIKKRILLMTFNFLLGNTTEDQRGEERMEVRPMMIKLDFSPQPSWKRNWMTLTTCLYERTYFLQHTPFIITKLLNKFVSKLIFTSFLYMFIKPRYSSSFLSSISQFCKRFLHFIIIFNSNIMFHVNIRPRGYW